MRIIGESDSGYVLEASRDEVANLIGYYSKYNYDKGIATPKPGDTIKVTEMFQRLYTLARRRGEIKTAQKMLRDAADELELVDPILGASEEKPSA
jgi:hypothetical protein